MSDIESICYLFQVSQNSFWPVNRFRPLDMKKFVQSEGTRRNLLIE
jgi:hypothetical protein